MPIYKGEVHRFGVDAHYTEFEATGFRKGVGSAKSYNDLYLPIAVSKPGGTAPNWENLTGNIEAYTFAIGDYVYGSTELLHDYEEGGTIEVHLHWTTNGSEVGDTKVAFTFEYTWANFPNTGALPALAAAATLTMADTTIAGGTADLTCQSTTIGNIALATGKIGAQLIYRFQRVALAGAGSNPAADPFCIAIGVHYLADTQGSRSQYTKT